MTQRNISLICQSKSLQKILEKIIHKIPGLSILDKAPVDLIIADHLPENDVLKSLHKENPKAQIFCLLDKTDTPPNLTFSIRTLTKPFRPAVLIEALSLPVGDGVLNFQGFKLYVPQRRLSYEDQPPISLTEKEVDLLKTLHQNASTPLSREVLLEYVWGYGEGITTHTLETHIYKLKQKLQKYTSESIIECNKDGYFLTT